MRKAITKLNTLKNITLPILLLLVISTSTFGQIISTEDSKGKLFGKIHFDAFSQIDNNANYSGMEIKRAYFGYQYHYDSHFTAYLKLDIGSPEDEYNHSLLKRYAYFKNAGMSYKNKKFTFNIGIIDVLMFTHQEKTWGHRYINKSFLDRYKFGPKADIGFNAKYDFNKYFSMDLGFYNGEGYTHIQNDNSYRGGLGLVSHPIKHSTLKVYIDYAKKNVVRWGMYSFADYNIKNKWNIGLEYNYQFNSDYTSDQNKYGYSAYSYYQIKSWLHIFGRFDKLNSNTLNQQDKPWNLNKDGSAITTGFQVELRKGILFSIDYQNWNPDTDNSSNRSFIFLNSEIKF